METFERPTTLILSYPLKSLVEFTIQDELDILMDFMYSLDRYYKKHYYGDNNIICGLNTLKEFYEPIDGVVNEIQLSYLKELIDFFDSQYCEYDRFDVIDMVKDIYNSLKTQFESEKEKYNEVNSWIDVKLT